MFSPQAGVGLRASISRSPLQFGPVQQQSHHHLSIVTPNRVQSCRSSGQSASRAWSRPERHVACLSSSAAAAITTGGGGNDKVGSGGNGGGGGGGGGGSSGKGDSIDPALIAILAAAGKSASSLPADMSAALVRGKVTAEILQRYLELESKFIMGWLLNFPGFRERLLADPSFLVKLAIEVGIGVCTKCTAEYTKRGDHFGKELDFVAANLVMAIIADFMLVWLPAPTLSYAAGAAAKARSPFNFFTNMFAGCPDNAFQKVQPGMPSFTVLQRMGAPVRNGLKLFGVGFGASLVGVGITNALIGLRQLLDPTFMPLNQAQDVVATSLAYGAYMATSSNLRYQVLAGVVEERGIETIFKGNYKLCAALSFLVRTGNTFLGSLLWVDFVRLLGMQKASH